MVWLFPTVLLLWALGFVFLFRVPPCRRREPAAETPAVSVIIPARDEEDNLPALLASLARQDPRPAEVIVVDDNSTDQTAAVARRCGAAVVPSKPLPEGWRGKPWACCQGAEAARGDVLLFVDADTFFERDRKSVV